MGFGNYSIMQLDEGGTEISSKIFHVFVAAAETPAWTFGDAAFQRALLVKAPDRSDLYASIKSARIRLRGIIWFVFRQPVAADYRSSPSTNTARRLRRFAAMSEAQRQFFATITFTAHVTAQHYHYSYHRAYGGYQLFPHNVTVAPFGRQPAGAAGVLGFFSDDEGTNISRSSTIRMIKRAASI